MDSTPPVQMIFAWVGRNQRLAKDFEATMESAGAFLYAASVMLLVHSDRLPPVLPYPVTLPPYVRIQRLAGPH